MPIDWIYWHRLKRSCFSFSSPRYEFKLGHTIGDRILIRPFCGFFFGYVCAAELATFSSYTHNFWQSNDWIVYREIETEFFYRKSYWKRPNHVWTWKTRPSFYVLFFILGGNGRANKCGDIVTLQTYLKPWD